MEKPPYVETEMTIKSEVRDVLENHVKNGLDGDGCYVLTLSDTGYKKLVDLVVIDDGDKCW